MRRVKKITLGVYYHELYTVYLKRALLLSVISLLFLLLHSHTGVVTNFEVDGDVQKVARESSCRHVVNMLFFYESSQGSCLELSELWKFPGSPALNDRPATLNLTLFTLSRCLVMTRFCFRFPFFFQMASSRMLLQY